MRPGRLGPLAGALRHPGCGEPASEVPFLHPGRGWHGSDGPTARPGRIAGATVGVNMGRLPSAPPKSLQLDDSGVSASHSVECRATPAVSACGRRSLRTRKEQSLWT